MIRSDVITFEENSLINGHLEFSSSEEKPVRYFPFKERCILFEKFVMFMTSDTESPKSGGWKKITVSSSLISFAAYAKKKKNLYFLYSFNILLFN